jgi:LysM repeat protein
MTFHNVMLRFLPAACALLCASALLAQDETSANAGSSPAPGTDDVRVLRQLIEQQSRQIETLTQQVSKLNQLLEARAGTTSAAATPAMTQNMPPVQESVASGNSPATSAAEPPKAVAAIPGADGGLTHVVAKGETLTVIAKHYKVSIADLLKVNRITDERKLQIGQTLTIPASAKPSDTSHP